MRGLAICLLCCLGGAAGHAQDLIQSDGLARPALFPSDMVVLEEQQGRKDLPCASQVIRPGLGFDLRMHAGYNMYVPLRELSSPNRSSLVLVFRIIPQHNAGQPILFSQRLNVPPTEKDARGFAQVHGDFNVGMGQYRVDWLLRDPAERVCSGHWVIDAKLPGKDRGAPLNIAPGVVLPGRVDLFEAQSRKKAGPLRVKVLVNFAPRDGALSPDEEGALVEILRNIGREPRIGQFSVVAFNLRDQQILYEQPEAPQIDFPALGKALEARPAGTIDVRRLTDKHGCTALLRRLIGARDRPMDALIVTGVKAAFTEDLSTEVFQAVGNVPYPVFYLDYIDNPNEDPWPDMISKAVHFLGGHDYTITHPHDMWTAWKDILSRLPARPDTAAVTVSAAAAKP